MVTAMALSTLTFYRLVERQLPMLLYVRTFIRFPRDRAMTEAEVRTLMKEHGFKVSNMCLAVTNDRQFFEYDLVINTRKERILTRLCQSLGKNGAVLNSDSAPRAIERYRFRE